jgi:hypothetical protein
LAQHEARNHKQARFGEECVHGVKVSRAEWQARVKSDGTLLDRFIGFWIATVSSNQASRGAGARMGKS